MLKDKRILFVGPISNQGHISDGYTNASTNLLAILSFIKDEGFIKSLDAIDLNQINTQNLFLPANYFDVIILIINPFYLSYPQYQEALNKIFEKGKKLFLQMVWETTPMPSSWNFIFRSDKFSGFIGPSQFVCDLIKEKTTKPVYYIPHYVDSSQFTQIDLREKLKENIFTVLSIGQWTKRKGMEDAIISFSRALGMNGDCRLFVKYIGMKDIQIDVEGQIKMLMHTNCPKVITPVMTSGNNMNQGELLELYKNSSLLLFPSRGEGFGLPVAEIMSVGIPILYTGWSSIAEVGKAPGNFPIKYLLDESVGMSMFGYEKGSKYAIPVISDAIEKLEYKYQMWKNNRELYYKETIGNYKIVNERYGKETVKNHVTNFLDEATK